MLTPSFFKNFIRSDNRTKRVLVLCASLVTIFLLISSPFVFAQETPGGEQVTNTTRGEEGLIAEDSCGINIFCAVRKAIQAYSFSILSFILSGAGYIFAVFAWLLQFLIQETGNLIQSEFVRLGFRITLGVTNLGFVLAIIVIAFATILRLEKYEMKQLLLKLIVAAVAVNFSLAIAGVILDFTNVFSYYFIEVIAPQNAPGGYAAFGDEIARGIQIQKLTEVKAEGLIPVAGDIFEFSDAAVSFAISLLFAILFTILSAIVMGGVALMLLYRYIAITVLLVLMPLAWLFWVIPNFSNLARQWWTTFLRWAFFLPGVTFFLMLAILSMRGVDTVITDSYTKNPTQAASALETHFAQNNGATGFLQIIVKLGLLAGALIAGNAMGIKGSSGALGVAKSAKNWAIGAAGAPGRFAWRSTKAGAEYVSERPIKATSRGGANLLTSRALRWLPGAKSAANRLAEKGTRQEDVDEYTKKNLANQTDANFRKMQASIPVGPVAKSAYFKKAAKEKKINDFIAHMPDEKELDITKEEKEKRIAAKNVELKKRLEIFAQAIKQTNPGTEAQNIPEIKEVLAIYPSLAPTLTDDKLTIKDAREKIRPEKISEVNAAEFKNEEMALLGRQQLIALHRIGSDAQIENLQNTVKKLAGEKLNNIAEKIQETQRQLTKMKEYGDENGIKKFGVDLKQWRSILHQELTKAAPKEKQAFEQIQTIHQIIGAGDRKTA